jgi:hypothetical protein
MDVCTKELEINIYLNTIISYLIGENQAFGLVGLAMTRNHSYMFAHDTESNNAYNDEICDSETSVLKVFDDFFFLTYQSNQTPYHQNK